MPIPEIDHLSFSRRAKGEDTFSIVGVTHSLSTSRIYHTIFRLLFAPLQNWDALICTSRAGRQAVLAIMESHLDYLRSRNVSAPLPPFELPVIPLGVDCNQFERTPERISAGRRWRQSRGIEDGDVAVLSFGRIDPLTKSHPLPLVMAVEAAQRRLKGLQRLHLVFAGQVPDPDFTSQLSRLIADFDPSFPIHWSEGPTGFEAESVWSAADIFVSLSDNVQETFGLTPVEAMAASLPCVVSDWSGYRETVVDRETGILVPACMPGGDSALGVLFGDRYEQELDPYPLYVGGLSQATSVDIEACAAGIEWLAARPDERMRMGRNGRDRARKTYDWSVVLSRYLELFDELRARRLSGQTLGARDTSRHCLHPFNPDPFQVFSGFCSNHVDRDTILEAVTGSDINPAWLLDHLPTGFSAHMLLPSEGIDILLAAVAANNRSTLGQVCTLFDDTDHERVLATCLWLAKYNLVRLHCQ